MKIIRGPEGALLAVRVVPRASREEILESSDGTVRVRVSAPALAGRANKALRKFLADQAEVSKSSVKIAAGEKSREKTILFAGLDAAQLEKKLRRKLR